MIFTFLGSTVKDAVHGPWVNGLALAIWIYAAANISGMHNQQRACSRVLLFQQPSG